MATSKGKKGTKKAAKMAKGKALQSVKPLQEAVTFNYGKLELAYKQQ
ncbi:MAG: hypothetical protein WB680_16205 [Candidatus Acidiferrales bacterium]